MRKLKQAEELDAIDGGDAVAFAKARIGSRTVRADFANDGGAGGIDADLAETTTLEPAGFLGFKTGFQGDRSSFAGAFDGVRDFLTATENDALGDGIEGSGEAIDRNAIDFCDLVPRQQASLGGRAFGQDISDFLCGNEIGRFSDLPYNHCGRQCQQHGEKRTGKSDDDFIKRGDRWKRFPGLLASLQCLHGCHLWQCNEAAGGNPSETVLHTIDLLFPNGLPEPDLKAINLETTPFCSPEVAEFVDKDDDVEKRHDDGDQHDHLNEGRK